MIMKIEIPDDEVSYYEYYFENKLGLKVIKDR